MGGGYGQQMQQPQGYGNSAQDLSNFITQQHQPQSSANQGYMTPMNMYGGYGQSQNSWGNPYQMGYQQNPFQGMFGGWGGGGWQQGQPQMSGGMPPILGPGGTEDASGQQGQTYQIMPRGTRGGMTPPYQTWTPANKPAPVRLGLRNY